MFKRVWPYADDAMNLPVKNLEDALPFYETVMGFPGCLAQRDNLGNPLFSAKTASRSVWPKNGGDPSQEGCFFEVDDVEAAFAELKARGLNREEAGFRVDRYGETSYRVFFVVAPDGLCYCLGQRQN